jgi:hypothetical protein
VSLTPIFGQVYLPAIAGLVPPQMVRAVSSILEFCYLVRRNVITEDDIFTINHTVAKFHIERSIFDDVRPDGYSLPRQHSLVHYAFLIKNLVHQTDSVHQSPNQNT